MEFREYMCRDVLGLPAVAQGMAGRVSVGLLMLVTRLHVEAVLKNYRQKSKTKQ